MAWIHGCGEICEREPLWSDLYVHAIGCVLGLVGVFFSVYYNDMRFVSFILTLVALNYVFSTTPRARPAGFRSNVRTLDDIR